MNVFKKICRLPIGEYVFTDLIYTSTISVKIDSDNNKWALIWTHGGHPIMGSIGIHMRIKKESCKIHSHTSINGISVHDHDAYLSDYDLHYVSRLKDFNQSKIERIKMNRCVNVFYYKKQRRNGIIEMRKNKQI